ncbi:uncharacterized protein ATC70_002532 [Mucor velutinosus]|uniref:Peptidase A1 domain-containing protein n=1 Tax=Mucor velutinosus TaxID=708070 RepID=A0AAN7HSW6_9FUNG|nr:hypothetical protein ATC70_002532 [Mucor velutinosus]
MINKTNYKAWITALAMAPSIQAAVTFPSFPTIQDQIFNFPKYDLHPPRIPLKYIRGVPTLPFSIGTPSQEFVGIFDTASPVTWVMSDQCTSSACSVEPDSEKFHAYQSSTNYKFPLRADLSYLDGTHVQLKPELDVMQFANIPFPPHLMAEAYQVDYPKGYLPPANARLGMGDFGSIDWTKTRFNLDAAEVPSTLAPGFLRSRRAAGDDRYSTGAANTGSSNFRKRGPFLDAILDSFFWVLGIDDSMYTGPIYQLPLAPVSGLSSPFWKIPIKGFRFHYVNASTSKPDQQFPFQKGAYGKVYSSSPVLTVPKATADAMNRAIGAVYNEALNLYTISCSAYTTAPSLVFQFGAGIDAEIPPQQYIYKLEEDRPNSGVSSDSCYSAISGGTDDINVFLGGPFFRSFYLVYQFSGQSVGMAESIAHVGKVYLRV